MIHYWENEPHEESSAEARAEARRLLTEIAPRIERLSMTLVNGSTGSVIDALAKFAEANTKVGDAVLRIVVSRAEPIAADRSRPWYHRLDAWLLARHARRAIHGLLLAVLLGGLVGCTPSTKRIHPMPFQSVSASLSITLYQDIETGCYYISNGRGITPRLTADGKPMCGEVLR